jgi:molecular chaperone GrpE (heat shock protein)
MGIVNAETINTKIETLNARQAVLNEQAQRARAQFEQMRQNFSQEVAALQNEFTENIGALKVLQSLLPQNEVAEKS